MKAVVESCVLTDSKQLVQKMRTIDLKGEFVGLLEHYSKARPSVDLFRAALAEGFATLIFVFLGCGSVCSTGEFLVDDAHLTVQPSVARVLPIATTFGLAITVLAFSVAPISGGHINPGTFHTLYFGLSTNTRFESCHFFIVSDWTNFSWSYVRVLGISSWRRGDGCTFALGSAFTIFL